MFVRHTACATWLATTAALLAVAACTGGSGDHPEADSATSQNPTAAGTSEGGEVGMRVTVVQQRTDIGTTRIGLEVTTDHKTTVHVTGVQLLSEAFEQHPMTPKDTAFTPDRTIDLTVDYGIPVCKPGVSVAEAQVLVHYDEGETERTVTLPVAKLGRDLLSNLHTGGCAQQRVDAAASLSYRTPFHREVVDGTPSLVGSLALKRPADGGSGEPVVVESVFGSVLFDFIGLDGDRRLGVLARGRKSIHLPVVIQGNNRCNPHERSASQQTFIFTADVRVGSAPLHREIIAPPTPLRVQAMSFLDDVC